MRGLKTGWTPTCMQSSVVARRDRVEIRIAYRKQVRTSHRLNRNDPGAASRIATERRAKVRLDPVLRRAYDRAPRFDEPGASAPVTPAKRAAWFERREQSSDNDWASPRASARERTSFGNFFGELRGSDGQLSLQIQELVESLSARQQIGVAALLCAVALGLVVMAKPQGLVGDSTQPTTVDVGSVFP